MAGNPFDSVASAHAPGPVTLSGADDFTLIEMISGGSGPAFTVLVDRTCEAARAELAGACLSAARCREILAATYVEVWWLAGCHLRPVVDATNWITSIVRRRIGEVSHKRAPVTVPRPSYAEIELAVLLGGSTMDPIGTRGAGTRPE